MALRTCESERSALIRATAPCTPPWGPVAFMRRGIHISTSAYGKSNSGGITPTMTYGSSAMVMARPTTLVSASNRRRSLHAPLGAGRVHAERNPHLDIGVWKVELRRHYADNDVRLVCNGDGAADNASVRMKPPPP